jgi:GT2 family glycosyltransferase
MASPRIEDSRGRVVFAGAEMSWATGEMRRTQSDAPADAWMPWLGGACLALHRDLFMTCEGFDEGYFMYWEDVDLSAKVLRAGGRLVVLPELLAVHDEGGTQDAADGPAKSPLYYYYNCRNRLLFARAHLTLGARMRWLAATPGASWQILMRGGRRQLMTSPGLAWSAARGSLSGVWRLLAGS